MRVRARRFWRRDFLWFFWLDCFLEWTGLGKGDAHFGGYGALSLRALVVVRLDYEDVEV